ncbi:MAG TPA: hypothetical protein VK590_15540 [Saprospiraceae bacterium]|nr:hypothetical protein [Saprospiraceae bacterium]
MLSFRKNYTIKDLQEIITLIGVNRDNFRIAIIDDQKIGLIKSLRQHSYRIDHFNDVINFDVLAKYDIIICDIQGVGKSLGSKYEGGHLIKEIRNFYPLKYIIAFSGKSFDVSYNKFFRLCDDVMGKYVDVTSWTMCLDMAMKNINNPIYIWNKTRHLLLKGNIDIDTISKVEKGYIKAIIKRDIKYFNFLSAKENSLGNSIAIIDAIGTYIQVILGLIQLSK